MAAIQFLAVLFLISFQTQAGVITCEVHLCATCTKSLSAAHSELIWCVNTVWLFAAPHIQLNLYTECAAVKKWVIVIDKVLDTRRIQKLTWYLKRRTCHIMNYLSTLKTLAISVSCHIDHFYSEGFGFKYYFIPLNYCPRNLSGSRNKT